MELDKKSSRCGVESQNEARFGAADRGERTWQQSDQAG